MSDMRLDVSLGALPPEAAFKQGNVVLSGHSIVAGAQSTRVGFTDFASRLAKGLDPNIFSYSSLGHGGYRIGGPGQASSSQLYPLAPSEVDTKIVAGRVNILLFMETINSVTFYQSTLTPAQTTAQTIVDYTVYLQARRAAGWDGAHGNEIGVFCMYPEYWWSSSYQQCVLDINTWLQTTALSLGLIDFVMDLRADPEMAVQDARWLYTDLTHPTDYGHQIIYDQTIPAVLAAYESQVGTKKRTWTPAFLPRHLFWVDMGQGGKYVQWDGAGNIFKLLDRSSWSYDFTAAGALQPTWSRSNNSIHGAGAATMTTTLAVQASYTKKLWVFMTYSCTSTGTVLCEFGPNVTTNVDGFAITNETTGPKVQARGPVGTSFATASAISGMHSVLFSIDNTLTTLQGNILLDGVAAPGLARTDAPNANTFVNSTLSLLGRATGLVPSTCDVRLVVGMTQAPSAGDLANLLAYAATLVPAS